MRFSLTIKISKQKENANKGWYNYSYMPCIRQRFEQELVSKGLNKKNFVSATKKKMSCGSLQKCSLFKFLKR
jgi:hypothetical protein